MAWWNPATWTPVDNIQGQNRLPQNGGGGGGGGWGGSTPLTGPGGLFIEDTQPLASPGATPPAPTSTAPAWTQQQQALRSQANALIAGLPGQAAAAAGIAGKGLGGGILDLIDTLRMSQKNVDRKAANNELAKRTGTQGVLSMIGRGIQSGGVLLANKNAAASSAAGALARAYGTLGREKLSGVGNQYEQGKSAVQADQELVDLQRAQGVRHTQEQKTNIIDSIVEDAKKQITAINQAMLGASLPDKINMAAEAEKIRQAALGQLSQYDQLLNQNLGGINAASPEQSRIEAARMAQAGVAPENAFDYGTAPAPEFAGGPFASTLPIFTFPRKRR